MASRERGDDSGGAPDEVWRRFAEDCRRSPATGVPREPSARERAAGARVAAPGPADAVGELWQPDDARETPAWRDLDGPGRRRLVCRALGAAAAVVLFLLVASGGPGSGREGYETPGGSMVQQSEDAPTDRPTTAESPPEGTDTDD
ncbi:hypothetical protein [Streptomyces sp. NPDC006997]|uniref:hypothetical protein n=1 Tax=Streptomyces sp. NPDC006997 TaxID=3155356 RepID=UPI0033CC4EAA